MKRIGMLKVSGHSYIFGGHFNEFDKEKLEKYAGPSTVSFLTMEEEPKIPFPDSRVTKVWDAERTKAEGFAASFGVERVAGSREEMLEDIDAALIAETSEDGSDHCELALPFLEAGIPTFVDKPFSNNIADANLMVSTAERTGTPLMSSSLLRYVRAVEEVKAEAEEIGEIKHVVATGPGHPLIYGIHTCELFHAVLGGGIESVHNLGEEDRDLVRVKYTDGKTVIMQILREMAVRFHVIVYGSKKTEIKWVPNYRYGAGRMMEHFVRMIETKEPPIPYEHTLEILKVLLASQKSLAEKREIALGEVR